METYSQTKPTDTDRDFLIYMVGFVILLIVFMIAIRNSHNGGNQPTSGLAIGNDSGMSIAEISMLLHG